jgi:hypothetical protein
MKEFSEKYLKKSSRELVEKIPTVREANGNFRLRNQLMALFFAPSFQSKFGFNKGLIFATKF